MFSLFDDKNSSMRFFLSFAMLVFSCCALQAQATIHFDRPYHVAGEVSWFAVYPGADAPPKARVSIHDASGKLMDYFFLQADTNGQLQGYYRWPFEAPTGYYRVSVDAYAEEGVLQLVTMEHPVYSDRRAEPDANALAPKGRMPAADGLTVSAEGGNISVGGLNGDAYSIAVYNADVVGEADLVLGRAEQSVTGNWVDTLFYEAKVGLADGTPVATNLLPIFDPATFTFGFSKSATDGSFLLQTSAFEGTKDVQARSLEELELHPQLTLPMGKETARTPPLTEDIAAYIDLSRRRRKIYQLFATVETEIDATVTPQQQREIPANRDFNVQDYKAFADMYNFFKEVGGELRVRVKKDNYRAQLYNAPNQRFFLDSPLYIVDGKLTRNNNYVNKMSPADVTYLAYYYDNRPLRRFFPALGNNGVVRIETLRPVKDFPAADAAGIFTIKGLQPTATFTPRDAAASEVPALSPLLLWRTGGGTQEAAMELPATDDFGNYRIVVVASGADGNIRAIEMEVVRNVK